MDNRAQLEFLKMKFNELSEQYLAVLHSGKSLQQIKDLSFVLECLRSEIMMLESELAHEQPAKDVNYVDPLLPNPRPSEKQ